MVAPVVHPQTHATEATHAQPAHVEGPGQQHPSGTSREGGSRGDHLGKG
jgi:hypothetical protein